LAAELTSPGSIERPGLELALAASSVGVWEVWLESGRMRGTEAFGRLHGLDPEADSVEQFEAAVHAEDRPALRAALQGAAAGERFELEYRLADAGERWLESRAEVVSDAGVPTLLAGISVEVTQRKRRELEQELLAEAGTIFSSPLNLGETLVRIGRLVVPRLADWFSVDSLEDSGEIRNLAVAQSGSAGLALGRDLRGSRGVRVEDAHGMGSVLRTGESELYTDISDSLLGWIVVDDAQAEIVRALGPRSAIVAPLVAAGGVIGTITVVSTEPRRQYGAEDVPFVEELALRAALAIENARLYAGERKARAAAERASRRAERLQAFTAALAGATSPAESVDVVVREGLEILGGDSTAVFLLSEDGTVFEHAGSAGYPEGMAEEWQRFPSDLPSPANEAVTTGALVTIGSREEFAERWPDLVDAQQRYGNAAAICAPLVSPSGVGGVGGVLYMSFREPRRFAEEDLVLVDSLARQCSQALERTRLYEAERNARADALRMARQLRALQSVTDSALAPRSLDDLLRDMLERVREALGTDTATVLILEGDDELVTRAALGVEEEAAKQIRIPVGQGFSGTIAAQRAPLVVEDASTFRIFSPVLRGSGVRSLAGVPLLAEGDRVVGVLHVGTLEQRRFSDDDVLLLRLVATRAALSIEHAVLHDTQRVIAETLQRSLLPERLPRVPGVNIGARYVPGSSGMEVGGDWYDALALPDGNVGLVIGDVVGRGIAAASAMGQLRNALRAYAFEGMGPAESLGRLNQLSFEIGPADLFATVCFCVVDSRRGEVRLASAGHPPPLISPSGGPGAYVEDGRGLPLGAVRDTRYSEFTTKLAPGATLLLYTDGVVERSGVPLDDSLARLEQEVRTWPGGLEPLLDHLLEVFAPDEHGDDAALLAVCVLGRPVEPLKLRFPARPSALLPVRSALRDWLLRAGASEQEIYDVTVACNEACTNSIEHPLHPPGSDYFEVEADCAGGEVTLTVRDYGRWRAKQPAVDRGRGLKFIHTFMDDVDVWSSDEGTQVHMRKRLGHGA
jgi:GAF domain-containing protein/anti-sigma regulatory factor (Ser/Thr protein kinase)